MDLGILKDELFSGTFVDIIKINSDETFFFNSA